MRIIVPLIVILCLSSLDLSGNSPESDTVSVPIELIALAQARAQSTEFADEILLESVNPSTLEIGPNRDEALYWMLIIIFLTFILAYRPR